MCGIIIQLPLPESINRKEVLDAIDPKLDVDCLGSVASQKFYRGDGEKKNRPVGAGRFKLQHPYGRNDF